MWIEPRLSTVQADIQALFRRVTELIAKKVGVSTEETEAARTTPTGSEDDLGELPSP